MKSTNWVIIYDIRDPKRLQKVSKAMIKYGVRVQKSVFEVSGKESFVEKIRTEIRSLIDAEEDFVVFFNICEKDWQKRVKYGKGKELEPELKEYIIV